MHSSGGWEVQDHGARRVGVWWELSPWVASASGHLLAVSSQAEGGHKLSDLFL